MDNKFRFGELQKRLVQMKHELPQLLANQAQNFFVGTFTKQSWDNVGWKEVKRRQEGTDEYKYPKTKGLSRRTSPILVRTGTLRIAVSNSVRITSFNLIRLVVGDTKDDEGKFLNYAKFHNDGDGYIPRRRFMGNSPILVEKQKAKIKQYIDKLWKN